MALSAYKHTQTYQIQNVHIKTLYSFVGKSEMI